MQTACAACEIIARRCTDDASTVNVIHTLQLRRGWLPRFDLVQRGRETLAKRVCLPLKLSDPSSRATDCALLGK